MSNNSDKPKLNISKSSGKKKIYIDFRDIVLIEPLGLKNYNPSAYKKISRRDYWFIIDCINEVTKKSKMEYSISSEQELRLEANKRLKQYDNLNLTEIQILREHFKKRMIQTHKNIIRQIPLFAHLFGVHIKGNRKKIVVKGMQVHAIGGWLSFNQVHRFVITLNKYAMFEKIIQSLFKYVDNYGLDKLSTKFNTPSIKTVGKIRSRELYDKYYKYFNDKFVERLKQTDKYGAMKYAGEETVNEIQQKEKITLKSRNVIDAMRKRMDR